MKVKLYWFPIITGWQNFTLSGLTPLVYLIISGFLFVVCSSRTILGNKKSAHVHLEGWKHGNKEVRLNMVCTE